MSDLEALETEIQGYRSQAAQLASDYAQTEREVARDNNLTDAGKTEALAPVHADTQEQMQALMAAEKGAIKRHREAAERALYGLSSYATPAELMSFRDAQDRANRLASQMDHYAAGDAKAAYDSAVRSGDKVLANAIFGAAVERGWTDIADDHTSRNPSVKPHLKTLQQIRRYEGSGFNRVANYYMPSMNIRGSQLPPALDGMASRPSGDDLAEAAAFFRGKAR